MLTDPAELFLEEANLLRKGKIGSVRENFGFWSLGSVALDGRGLDLGGPALLSLTTLAANRFPFRLAGAALFLVVALSVVDACLGLGADARESVLSGFFFLRFLGSSLTRRALMESEILLVSVSTPMTFALTTWPTWTAWFASCTNRLDSSEI